MEKGNWKGAKESMHTYAYMYVLKMDVINITCLQLPLHALHACVTYTQVRCREYHRPHILSHYNSRGIGVSTYTCIPTTVMLQKRNVQHRGTK